MSYRLLNKFVATGIPEARLRNIEMIMYQGDKHITHKSSECKFTLFIIQAEDRKDSLHRERSFLKTLKPFSDLPADSRHNQVHPHFISHSTTSPLKHVLKLP